jgi:hypothetical protein
MADSVDVKSHSSCSIYEEVYMNCCFYMFQSIQYLIGAYIGFVYFVSLPAYLERLSNVLASFKVTALWDI